MTDASKSNFLTYRQTQYTSRYTIWASGAAENDKQTPVNARILKGWTIEQPTHSLFNWYMNRTDTRLEDAEAMLDWLESRITALEQG